MSQVESPALGEPTVVACARHPNVETALRCGRCETPICPRCMVITPVGARCPACANVRRFNVGLGPAVLARAAAAGIGVSLVGSLIALSLPFFQLFALLGAGYATGKVVSNQVKRRPGRMFAGMAAGCFAVGFLLSPIALLLIQGQELSLGVIPLILFSVLRSVMALVGLAGGALLAWMQAR